MRVLARRYSINQTTVAQWESRTLRRSWVLLAAGLGLAAGNFVTDVPRAVGEDLAVSATVTGPAEVIFNWKRDGCERAMAPDEPARAFRNDRGVVVVLATDDQNWSMSGPSLNSVKRSCNSVFHASGMPQPGSFDNDGWIEGVFTSNGRDVLALISNDWAASRGDVADKAASGCADRGVAGCDYMSITIAKSSNGGESFTYLPGDHVLAALPFSTFAAQHQTAGFAVTSNIFEADDQVYAFLGKRSKAAGQAGSCLFRSRQPFDPESWMFWGGHSFSAEAADDRKDPAPHGVATDCVPVTVPFPQVVELRSVSLLKGCNCYVAAFDGARKDGDGQVENGFFITASTDLLSWSKPALVMRRPFIAECKETLVYPSLLDPAAEDRNFFDITHKPYLYYTRMNRTSCKGTANRDLVRVPITIMVQK